SRLQVRHGVSGREQNLSSSGRARRTSGQWQESVPTSRSMDDDTNRHPKRSRLIVVCVCVCRVVCVCVCVCVCLCVCVRWGGGGVHITSPTISDYPNAALTSRTKSMRQDLFKDSADIQSALAGAVLLSGPSHRDKG